MARRETHIGNSKERAKVDAKAKKLYAEGVPRRDIVTRLGIGFPRLNKVIGYTPQRGKK